MNPFVIKLSKTTTLTIRRKDRLGRVATRIARSLPVSRQTARQTAAFYFALGTRLATKKLGGPWRPSELSEASERRYLID